MKYDVEIIRSNRKTLCLEVTPDLRIIARVPFRMSQNEIRRLIRLSSDWILKETEKIKALRKLYPELPSKLNEDEIDELRERTRRIVTERVEHYAQIIGVKYNKITVKIQRKRWGSCSGKRNLNFNLLLGLCPIEVIDYVVVHELCHLIEFNHSERFWTLVRRVLPDYDTRLEWLKRNAKMLLWRIS